MGATFLAGGLYLWSIQRSGDTWAVCSLALLKSNDCWFFCSADSYGCIFCYFYFSELANGAQCFALLFYLSRNVRCSLHLVAGLDDTDNYFCVFNHRVSCLALSGRLEIGNFGGVIFFVLVFRMQTEVGQGLLDSRHYMYGSECSVDCYLGSQSFSRQVLTFSLENSGFDKECNSCHENQLVVVSDLI